MKKLNKLLSVLFLSLFFTTACSDNERIQEETNNNKSMSLDYAAADPRLTIEIKFLKVPKRINPITPNSPASTGCTFGLGLCITISLDVFSLDTSIQKSAPSVLINDNAIIAVFNHNSATKKANFYLPKKMLDFKEFSQEDMEEFTVYEDMDLGQGLILKRGDYGVQYDSNGNYVYTVDTY